jgi:hypothetical protein
VKDKEEIRLKGEDQPLAHAAQRGHPALLEFFRRRRDGADGEGVAHSEPLQRLSEHSRRQRLEIDDDIGQLRHRASLE